MSLRPFLFLFLLLLLLPLPAPAAAEIRNLLVTASSRLRLAPTSLLQRRRRPPAAPAPLSELPYTPKCLAALGLADGYPIINDRCVLARWRPGQTWRFDDAVGDRWQPITVASAAQARQYCLAVDVAAGPGSARRANATHPEDGSRVVVRACDAIVGNGTATAPGTAIPRVNDEGMWLATSNGNGTYWFRNLRNKLCLTAADDADEFRMRECRDDPLQKYTLQWH
jgi:hypothetical protein